MDKMLLARQLYGVAEKSQVIYLRMEPELVDYTVHAPGKFVVCGTGGTMELPFDRHTIRDAVALLDVAVFTGKVVLGWNFKNVVSYVRHYLKKPRDYNCTLYDLKLIEGFLGRRGKAPADLEEATRRAMEFSKDKSWKQVWERVHHPLVTRVIPSLENSGIADVANRRVSYPYYEIEGTVTGRMKCYVLSKGYNPHNIPETDESLKPQGEDELFAYFDYKSMEVGVLQWLSGDENLGSILASGRDMYEAIWGQVTGQAPAPEDREKCKLLFLPVMFGLGAAGMSRDHGWSEDVCRELIRRIHTCFPQATKYMLDLQELAKSEPVRDHFGRLFDCRSEPYRARNRVIQSSAATICQERLVALHDRLPEPARIAFNVHDGYAVFCETRALPDVCRKVLAVLEAESELTPGLRLKSAAKVGKRLNKLVPIPSAWR